MLMSLLAWIILGLIAGFLAGLVMKGGGYGVIGDIVVGILGAMLGGWLSSMLFNLDITNNFLNPVNILIAFIGAVLLIFLLRMVTGSRTRV